MASQILATRKPRPAQCSLASLDRVPKVTPPPLKNPRSANGSVLAAVLPQQQQQQHQCYHATARMQGQCAVGLHSCSGRLILHRAGGTLRLTNEIDDSHHCVIAGLFSRSHYVISNTLASARLSLAAARSVGARYVTHRVTHRVFVIRNVGRIFFC